MDQNIYGGTTKYSNNAHSSFKKDSRGNLSSGWKYVELMWRMSFLLCICHRLVSLFLRWVRTKLFFVEVCYLRGSLMQSFNFSALPFHVFINKLCFFIPFVLVNQSNIFELFLDISLGIIAITCSYDDYTTLLHFWISRLELIRTYV